MVPLGFILTGANFSGFDQAKPFLCSHLRPGVQVITNKGYDSDAIRAYVNQLGGVAVQADMPGAQSCPFCGPANKARIESTSWLDSNSGNPIDEPVRRFNLLGLLPVLTRFMTEIPLVSVIVPNYNYRRFLPERLSSIFNQTYRKLEVIFLDDASDDGSVGYVKGLESPFPLRVIANTSNCGVYRQWQRGVGEARGKYIWIAEADDWCEPEFVQQLLGLAQRHPSAGFVYCQSRIIDLESRVIEQTPTYLQELDPDRWQRDFFVNGRDEVANYLILRNTVPNASACLFRRDVMDIISWKNFSLRLCGDWLAYVSILEKHDLAYLANPLNRFRRHEKSVRASSDLGGLSIRETYGIQAFITEHFPVLSDIRELACRFTFREWSHLRKKRLFLKQPEDDSRAILKAAKLFDPGIDRRIVDASRQDLPCLLVQQRGRQTLLRWKSQWKVYRDDRTVRLKVNGLRGKVRIDPLRKAGSTTILRLAFFPPGASRETLAVEGAEVGNYLQASKATTSSVDEIGFHITGGKKAVFCVLFAPKRFDAAPTISRSRSGLSRRRIAGALA